MVRASALGIRGWGSGLSLQDIGFRAFSGSGFRM